MVGLGDLAGGVFYSNAQGVSTNGSTIVGAGRTVAGLGEIGERAVRWISGGAPEAIGDIDYASASAVSGDGLTIVGESIGVAGGRGFRWTLATGMVGLGVLPGGGVTSCPLAVSTNGGVIVGFGYHWPASSEQEAFRWTEASGMVGLGDLPGGSFSSYALDVSGDGTYIVGASSTTTTTEAFIWDSAHGMRNLRDVLITDYGVTNLTGWTLSSARGISADGQTIVGDGINPSGQMEAWRVTGVPGPLALTLNPSLHGSISGSTGHYFPNTTATLTAAPSPGYLFTGWTGDATGAVNPLWLCPLFGFSDDHALRQDAECIDAAATSVFALLA